jgi:predicted dehydrogenase
MKQNSLAERAGRMKIGIIGSDNSHAKVFAKALNVENHAEYATDRITHIWGTDATETADKVTDGKIPNVAENPTDMIGQVDAAILVLRHGGLHLQHALPYLAAKVPLFIDKPLTTTTADARVLLEQVDKFQVPMTSFSTVRYDSSVQNLKNSLPEFGAVTSGDVAGIIVPTSSQYGGMIFYGIHVTEVLLELFGYGVEKIWATEVNENTIAIASYPTAVVTLHFLGQASYFFSATVHGKEKSIYQKADTGDNFPQGLKRIMEMFRTGKKDLTYAQLFEPVAIHAAIEKSLKEKREVKVEKF